MDDAAKALQGSPPHLLRAELSRLRIHFCGVRGSVSAPGIDFVRYGGHTSCLALAHDEAIAPTLLLDAGTGLMNASKVLDGAPFAGTILLSHLHWDHVLGLPFFFAGQMDGAHVRVTLPEQDSGVDAATVLAGMMAPPFFPVGPTELCGDWSFGTIAAGKHEFEGFSVLARELPHMGGRTFGYRVSDGHSTIAYLPDHCPTAFGPGEDGIGEYHAAALELARDADVVVHDARLLAEELEKEPDFGHAVAEYAIELARRAGARSVVLFHHRHDRTDDELDGFAARFSASSPAVSVASEGTVLSLAG